MAQSSIDYSESLTSATPTSTISVNQIQTTKKNFVYVDIESINDEFKCPICLDPFDDPVSTPCDHTFCRECIETSIESSGRTVCPVCRHRLFRRAKLKSANRIITQIIDRYPIKCLRCEERCLRGEYEEHVNKICPKEIVSCPAAKVRCPWMGPRDQLQDHRLTCPYEQLQPVLSKLLSDSKRLRDQLDLQAEQLQEIQDEKDSSKLRKRFPFFACIRRST